MGRPVCWSHIRQFIKQLTVIGSIIMISLGIIGYYIAQIYIESKDRPRYLVSQTIKEAKNDDPDA